MPCLFIIQIDHPPKMAKKINPTPALESLDTPIKAVQCSEVEVKGSLIASSHENDQTGLLIIIIPKFIYVLFYLRI